jgi:MFS family permease
MTEAAISQRAGLRTLPRNVWAVSFTSFFMDVASEMVLNILPLFLSNVLGVKTNIIGLIEGIAEATASLLKVFSGWLSDKLRARKWLAVAGYALSALAKPFFYVANSWGVVAGVRWADRVGKGVRTAPRDALVADSIDQRH